MAIRRMELRNAVADMDLDMFATATKKALRKAEKEASTIEEAVSIVMAEAEFNKFDKYANVLSWARRWKGQIADLNDSGYDGDLFAAFATADYKTAEQISAEEAEYHAKHAEYSKKLQLCTAWLDAHPRCLSGYTL